MRSMRSSTNVTRNGSTRFTSHGNTGDNFCEQSHGEQTGGRVRGGLPVLRSFMTLGLKRTPLSVLEARKQAVWEKEIPHAFTCNARNSIHDSVQRLKNNQINKKTPCSLPMSKTSHGILSFAGGRHGTRNLDIGLDIGGKNTRININR